MTLLCNLNAIAAADRPRYEQLGKQLRGALRENEELADGYSLRLDNKDITLRETAEWMSMERLCCPFLTLELATSGSHPDCILKLTGPTGVKAILQTAFAIR